MNVLTHSRALVKSVELNPHRQLLFRQFSGGVVSTKTRTFTLKHTLQPTNLHRRSTANHRYRYLTAMNPNSDSHTQTHEIETTMAKTFDDGASVSSLDEQSVVADEETRDADQNGVIGDVNENDVEGSKTADEGATSSSVDDHSVVVANNENEGEGEQRKVLPEELSRSVVKLSCESSAEGGNCDVYVVGTAHVSMVSCQEVEAVIRFLKPQVVFLELCSNRVAVLSPQNLKVPTMGEMVDLWKKNHNMFGIIYSWFLAKVASRLEVFPGSEFRVGYEEALAYGGKVILGDRPVNITLRRTWSKMPLWHKTKLIYSLMFQSLFLPSPLRLNEMLKELDDADMLTLVIQEMSKKYPTLMETLVHERDQYMSSHLLKVAREHSSVVAVVGKGHLQGIKKYWKQPVDVRELLELPSAKPAISVTRVLSTVGVAVAGVAIISGIYISSRK